MRQANRSHSAVIILAVVLSVVGGCLYLPVRSAAQSTDLPPLPDPALLADPVFARPGYAGVASAFLNRTRYLLAIDVDPYNGILRGRARVLYVNATGGPLSSILFRLYPNHPTHGARRMMIQAVTLNGSALTTTFQDAQETTLAVNLPLALLPGETTTLDFDYTISIPASSFFYIAEPLPIAAVYDYSGWRTEVASGGLDYAFTESALYAVNLRAPTRVGTWFVGALKTAQDSPDGKTTYTIVTGPVRNFVIIQAQGWGTFDVSGAAVPIRVLYSGSEAVAREIGEIALATFNFFDATFAPYPYAEFDLIVMRFPSGGEEYPWLVFIHNERDSTYRRFITAHEVAHQWFYGIAGNDTLRSAWLDESLVQIAGYLFYLKTGYGGPNAPETFWQSILTWYNRIQVVRPINTALADFSDFADYMSTTYGGGAVLMREIAELIGVDAFIAGLRDYTLSVNLGIGTPCQFYSALQRYTNVDLRPIFSQRIGVDCP